LLRQDNIKIKFYTMNKPVFYIYAPDYTEMSSGRKALHLICDKLNNMGLESYVTCKVTSINLWTPKLSKELYDHHKAANRIQIAIYPEVEMGNPLQCKNVIRWLLNKPNFFTPNWFGQFEKTEFIIHYAEEFRPPWINSNLQYIGTIDRNIFNTKNISKKREGVIVYHNRVQGKEEFPDWIKKIDYISSSNPKSPFECSQLYKNASALIIYERAASHVEAALCGCPTIFREHANYNADSVFSSYWKISSYRNFHPNINELNHGNGEILEKLYDNELIVDSINFNNLIEKAIDHFKFVNGNSPDQIESIQLALIEHYLSIKDLKAAELIINRIIESGNISNYGRYVCYKFCKVTSNNEARKILEDLISSLESMNDVSFLGKIIIKLKLELQNLK